MITIDIRGMREREALTSIRDAMAHFCMTEFRAEILADEQASLNKIKMFGAMSGCRSRIDQRDGHWAVLMEGDASSCR
ncbi:MAG: hypothetical protein HZA20_05835 [Nitrospirae bacterium]|nr:hypothetical protein [Nitrospirota bacterium]